MTSYIRIYPPSVTSRHCSNKNRAPLVHSYIQFKSRSHKWLMGACQCMGWQIHMLRIFSLQAHRTPCVEFPLFFALLYFRFLFVNDPAMANISLRVLYTSTKPPIPPPAHFAGLSCSCLIRPCRPFGCMGKVYDLPGIIRRPQTPYGALTIFVALLPVVFPPGHVMHFPATLPLGPHFRKTRFVSMPVGYMRKVVASAPAQMAAWKLMGAPIGLVTFFPQRSVSNGTQK